MSAAAVDEHRPTTVKYGPSASTAGGALSCATRAGSIDRVSSQPGFFSAAQGRMALNHPRLRPIVITSGVS